MNVVVRGLHRCAVIGVLCVVHLLCFAGAAHLAGRTRAPSSAASQSMAPTSPPSVDVVASPVDPDPGDPDSSDPGSADSGLTSDSSEDRATATRAQLRLLANVLLVCLLHSLVVVVVIDHSRAQGLGLMFRVWVLFFACMTIMPMSELLFFVARPGAILRTAVIMGLVVTTVLSIVSVLLMGRIRFKRSATEQIQPENRPSGAVAWQRLTLILLAGALWYSVLYLCFGYFVAWQSPELRRMYQGHDELLSFWQHVVSEPFLTKIWPLQLVRGLVWSWLVWWTLGHMTGGRWRLALIVGAALAVWMNAQLLLPNPSMSAGIRQVHLLETAASNFLFGLSMTWLCGAIASRPAAGSCPP